MKTQKTPDLKLSQPTPEFWRLRAVEGMNTVKPPRGLRFLYCTAIGRIFLHVCIARRAANIYAWYLNSFLSRRSIKKFIRKNMIDTSEYIMEKFKSFNDFFKRKIRPECRPVDTDKNALISPCDGKLTAFNIDGDSVFNVKGFDYSLKTLVQNEKIAKEFEGGICLIFRLTVSDYHRYIFFDGGGASDGGFIAGKLHTVQPTALEKRRVFTENCREYTLLHTDNFGDALQVEVGAMFVGRIVNTGKKQFKRGDEKGWFEFGGSTVILVLKKESAEVDSEIFKNTLNGFETQVKCGEKIGTKIT